MTDHIIDSACDVKQALKMLNKLSGGNMTLFVTAADGRMLGTLTDGDIRRALIDGHTLDEAVANVMNRGFKALRGKDVDVSALPDLRRRGIKLVPVLDDDGRISRIIDLSGNRSALPLSAILMAGGKGERLRPMTLDTPKPLLKIGGKAIIDYNIEALANAGITDINVAIRYLADKMREHFDREICGVMVKCVEEDRPLGTIGAAALCDLPDDGFTLVMNSDLLTNVSFEDMYLHHAEHGADVTVAVIPYQVSVPFAIVTTDETSGLVDGIAEKPVYSYFANAGIYIFPNSLLKSVSTDKATDATDLIEQAIAQGLRVDQYPLNCTWIDVGSKADFDRACELLRYVNLPKA